MKPRGFGLIADLQRGARVPGAILCPRCWGEKAELVCDECGDRGWLPDDGDDAEDECLA